MPNLLTLPFKSTTPVPIRTALREYILATHTETHPDAFKWDIDKWETMRKGAVSNTIHVATVDKLIVYHAHLVFILTKLPSDINLSFSYSRPFPATLGALPLALSNLYYERGNILYNLAALYCHLANSEDRSNNEGIKRALTNFQNAAGALAYLISSTLRALEASLSAKASLPVDLSHQFLKVLQCLMLAQAQECFWQHAANNDNVKNLLIAKLAAKTSMLYSETLDNIEADPVNMSTIPREWVAHIRTKYHHFMAAAHYRKSVDDMESNRYGEEVVRLDLARMEAKKAVEAAKKGGVAKTVQDDAQSLLTALESSFKRSERDNDLIYHHTLPSASSIPKIADIKSVVNSTITLGLEDPKSYIGENAVILGELPGWGVRMAVDIYKERKKDWIQLEMLNKAKQLDAEVAATLRSLSLPAALDALDRPIGLPPSLLGKAEEVRSEDGLKRISALMETVQKLTRRNLAAIDGAFDVLDQEATEDEEMRSTINVHAWTRPPSYEANKGLVEQANQYRDVLERAMQTDRETSNEWDRWSEKIAVLCWDEADIEQSIPTSTISPGSVSSAAKSTQAHARALRSHLEALEDIQHTRVELIHRVEHVAEVDDVAPRFMREASSIARWVEVRPQIFEQAIEEELNKYERYRQQLEQNQQRQEEALNVIRDRHVLLFESRKQDPSVKAREYALQDLDLAYHHYRDVYQSLTEGIKFHNDLGTLIAQMKESFKEWILQRQKDVEWLPESLNTVSLNPPVAMPIIQPAPSPPQTPASEHEQISKHNSTHKQHEEEFMHRLPPPDSVIWEHVPQSQSKSSSKPLSATPARVPPNQTAQKPLPEEFTLNLPPPDSSMWESMTPSPGTPVSRKKPTRRAS